MDFLDPKKQRRHAVLLYLGYLLIGIAIVISTVVLVYQANGYGVNSKGQVTQNGLLFFSSQPNPATIYLNGKKSEFQTNTRLSLAAGQYSVELRREGYRTWQRPISVQGGDVQNFDYPFLFPSKLTTKTQATYANGAGVASQSRDKRWLLVQQTSTASSFDLYDLENPTVPAVALTLPAALLHSNGTQTWEAIAWAGDNQHALFKHTYNGGTEFILIDKDDPAKSLNLNNTFGTNPTALTFIDGKYDRYHLFNKEGAVLSTATLGEPQPVKLLEGVLEYKSYGSKLVVYATPNGAKEPGKVAVSLFDGEKSEVIREVSANTTYLLDMASYDGKPYVVLSAASENIAYVYRDPQAQFKDESIKMPNAIRALKITSPSYVAFSPTAQYISVQSGNQLGMYDIYLKRAYIYTVPHVFDAPQVHGSWMDGNRFSFVSQGTLLVFDYDRRNQQKLMPASSSYTPFFSPDYRAAFTLAPGEAGAMLLTQTNLVTNADL